MKKSRKYTLMSIVTVILFLGLWELSVDVGWISYKMLASPSQVISTLIDKFTSTNPDGATIQQNTLYSLTVWGVGFFIGAAAGTLIGLFAGWSKTFERFMIPYVWFFKYIPAIAWLPLIILWFGIDFWAKTLVIAIAAFAPCYLGARCGVRKLLTRTKAARTAFISWEKRNIHRFPIALQEWLPALHRASLITWGVEIAYEILALNSGLGYLIIPRNFIRLDIMILGMAIIGRIGALLEFIFTRLENRLLRWQCK